MEKDYENGVDALMGVLDCEPSLELSEEEEAKKIAEDISKEAAIEAVKDMMFTITDFEKIYIALQVAMKAELISVGIRHNIHSEESEEEVKERYDNLMVKTRFIVNLMRSKQDKQEKN